jgi:hypothetical protein
MVPQAKLRLIEALDAIDAAQGSGQDSNDIIETYSEPVWRSVLAHQHSRSALRHLLLIPEVEKWSVFTRLPNMLVGGHGLVSVL